MLSRTYWPALQANWKAWTLVQLINLKYVPSEVRQAASIRLLHLQALLTLSIRFTAPDTVRQWLRPAVEYLPVVPAEVERNAITAPLDGNVYKPQGYTSVVYIRYTHSFDLNYH